MQIYIQSGANVFIDKYGYLLIIFLHIGYYNEYEVQNQANAADYLNQLNH